VFLYAEQYRYVIYALAALVALLPPPLTRGGVDIVAAMSVGTASLVFEHLIVPGVHPLFIGLPDVLHLLS